MSLTFHNYSKDFILKQLRNINYLRGGDLYNTTAVVKFESLFELSVLSLAYQADVFARELVANRVSYNFKIALGSYTDDWKRLIHEAYVYDRCKCIYYGINANNISDFPKNRPSFPGNVMLAHLLKYNSFSFRIGDKTPQTLYFEVDFDRNLEDVFRSVKVYYPRVLSGLPKMKGNYNFVNDEYENVLNGLNELNIGRSGEAAKGKKGQIFQMIDLGDEKIATQFNDSQFPFMNSFFSLDYKTFNFIYPTDKPGPESLKYDESVFLPRALGLMSKGLTVNGNNPFSVVPHEFNNKFISSEVYSVTGLKTDLEKSSDEYVTKYMCIEKNILIPKIWNLPV